MALTLRPIYSGYTGIDIGIESELDPALRWPFRSPLTNVPLDQSQKNQDRRLARVAFAQPAIFFGRIAGFVLELRLLRAVWRYQRRWRRGPVVWQVESIDIKTVLTA